MTPDASFEHAIFSKNSPLIADMLLKYSTSSKNDLIMPAVSKKNIERANATLDKYYTKKEIANTCIKVLFKILEKRSVSKSLKNPLFIEPSAGSGVFMDVMPPNFSDRIVGFDISPSESKHKIIKNDFLKEDFRLKIKNFSNCPFVFIGNPPFGTKSSLAISFLNKALTYGEIVAFIVPIQFKKWSVQSKIDPKARLIFELDLPEKSFEFLGKDYGVRCCFQIWTKKDYLKRTNLRLRKKPDVSHPDFEMYQYNRTQQALKFFEYDWDFAVPRQGYLDYSIKKYKARDCDKKHQWIFFKAKSPQVLENLNKLDFIKLSLKNTGIPGFGKADVVSEYIKTFGLEKTLGV